MIRASVKVAFQKPEDFSPGFSSPGACRGARMTDLRLVPGHPPGREPVDPGPSMSQTVQRAQAGRGQCHFSSGTTVLRGVGRLGLSAKNRQAGAGLSPFPTLSSPADPVTVPTPTTVSGPRPPAAGGRHPQRSAFLSKLNEQAEESSRAQQRPIPMPTA